MEQKDKGKKQILFFNSLIGIRPSTTLSASVNEKDEPMQGYQKFVIAPKPVGDLKYVKSTYETLYGTILVDWTRQSGTFTLNVSVPVNTTAIVYLPGERCPPAAGGNLRRSRI